MRKDATVSMNSKKDLKKQQMPTLMTIIVRKNSFIFADLGPQWDIINGYMGGGKINQQLTYE